MHFRSLYIKILISFLFANSLQQTHACSCVKAKTAKIEIERVEAVLVGVVLKEKLLNVTDTILLNYKSVDSSNRLSPMVSLAVKSFEILVQYIYKGPIIKDTITVFTGMGGGDCGFDFIVGEKYIIYGTGTPYFSINNAINKLKGSNIFWTNICMRTVLYNQQEIDEIEVVLSKKGKGV